MNIFSEVTSPVPSESALPELESAQATPNLPIFIPAPETEVPEDQETSPSPEPIASEAPAEPSAEPTALPSPVPPTAEPPESPLPEDPVSASPVPTAGTQEMLIVEAEEVAAEDEGPGFIPGLAGGFLLGAVLAAVLSRIVFRGKKAKALPIVPKKITGIAVQGQGNRDDQQDALFLSSAKLYSQQGILMCVADGMGGLSNGSMCSSTAVSAVANKFAASDKTNPQQLLAALVQSASSAVNRLLSPNLCSGGTTLLLGYIRNSKFYYASVGDSRISIFRNNRLIHLNRRHVYEDELLLRHVNCEMGFESAKSYEKGGALTSFLGMGALKYLDMPQSHVQLCRGDRLILMSDGVFNTLSDSELCDILRLKPSLIHDRLVDAVEAKKMLHQDNYSAVIITMD